MSSATRAAARRRARAKTDTPVRLTVCRYCDRTRVCTRDRICEACLRALIGLGQGIVNLRWA